MAKKYDLEKSKTTGWWVWECKDGSAGGSATSKSDAKEAAAKACGGSSRCVISPPVVDAVVYRGHLAHFTVLNLDETPVTFSAEEISESEFSFYFGLPCANPEEMTDARKAIVILKIWGLYRGGQTATQIKKLHNMNDAVFQNLVRRQYRNGIITVDDKGKIDWKL